ncbi:MAG TPA: hypothetical protein VHO50_05315 [Bacteroidales bacterium]|nr:hypothetical protein [Bacteroidales bacterium]
MKKSFVFLVFLVLAISCKETEFSPEGPTDVRIRNSTGKDFSNVIIKTSDYEEDETTIALIPVNSTTEYMRFKKAFPKLQFKADIQLGSTTQTISTGTVDFTYLHYLSTQRVTFDVVSYSASGIPDLLLIPEEELVLK